MTKTKIEVTNETVETFKDALVSETHRYLSERLMKINTLAVRGACSFTSSTTKIKIVENLDALGQYHSEGDLIYLNKCLTYGNMEVAKKILLHELAHYIEFKNTGNTGHSPTFRTIAEELGGYTEAEVDVIHETTKSEAYDPEGVVKKVQKLFSLASSDNQNEAELATAKANQLIQQYSLRYVNGEVSLEDKVDFYRASLISYNRTSYTIENILPILRKFGVYATIYRTYDGYSKRGRTRKLSTLEVSGPKANVEVATYAFEYLYPTMEKLYKEYRKKHKTTGAGAKASFMEGFYFGFKSKINTTKNTLNDEQEEGLIQYSGWVDDMAHKTYYKDCVKGRYIGANGGSYNSGAYGAGQSAGKSTNLNPGVRSSGGRTLRLS